MSDTAFTFGVDHLQLPVSRGALRLARDFYQRQLGLAEVRDPRLDRPGTLRFALGATRLDLVESDAVAISPHAHLALRVIGVDALAADFAAAGVAVDDVPLGDRARIVVVDPFGHRLELIEATPSSRVRWLQEDLDATVGG